MKPLCSSSRCFSSLTLARRSRASVLATWAFCSVTDCDNTSASSTASTWPRLTASPSRTRTSLTLASTSAARLPLVSALSEPVKEIVAASGRGVATTTSALDSARAAGAEAPPLPAAV